MLHGDRRHRLDTLENGRTPVSGTVPICARFPKGALGVCGMLAAFLHAAAAPAAGPVEAVITLISEERHSEARSALNRLLEREPGAHRLRLIDGVLREREGKTAEAIAVFEGLRKDRPDMVEPYNNLAVLYARTGRLDAARDVAAAALEIRPDATTHANLGDIYMRLADRAYGRARQLAAGAPSPALRGAERRPASETAPKSRDSTVPASPSLKAKAAESKPVPPARQAAVPGPMRLVPSALGGQCLRAGRFKDSAAAAEAAAWLRLRGAEVIEIRDRRRRIVKNYRVYLPPAANAREAAAKVRELRGRGIRDVAVVASGARANAVSLGLYISADNARKRVAQLGKLGISAESGANTKTIREYGVSAKNPGDRSGFERAWQERFPEHPVRYVDCR